MSAYVMKPIDEQTPKDRNIVLGCHDYGTRWTGRWDADAGEFMPRCSPHNTTPDSTWERPDHWCDLPGWPEVGQ